MRALEPTVIAVVGPVNVMPYNATRSGTAGCAHVRPPSVVRSDVPPSPTATPVFVSPNATEVSRCDVPPVGANHVRPPSVVRRIVPAAPTITPLFAVTNCTLRSAEMAFESCRYQPGG